MIQLNLLPEVKQQYIRAQRAKQIVMTVSFTASVAALAVLFIAFSAVYVVQKKVISDLQSSIRNSSTSLKNTPNLSDILTVQGQLRSLSTLHASKPVTSRVFGYLSQLTPTQATIADLRVDYSASTMSISGNAPGLDVVNTFVDGLKYTTYTEKNSPTPLPAFSRVVLASFSRSATAATYSINLTFNPLIFDPAHDISLQVGSGAANAQPSVIFKKGN